MTKRRHISTKRRLALFTAKGGLCHLCGGKVVPPQAWDVSHVIPLELGGVDDESNWDVAHRKCHRAHTAEHDVPAIAKAKRREARFVCAKTPSFRKLEGAPFRKAPPQRKATRPLKRPSLPPRPYYHEPSADPRILRFVHGVKE